MKVSRRTVIGGAAAATSLGLVGCEAREDAIDTSFYVPKEEGAGEGMKLRDFGSTGMKVSEVGFGAWAIGGQSYGPVERKESLNALARAEELGCNFVDTAAVYGDSEAVLGEFLAGRRDKWIIASKFSGQAEGVEGLVEQQLQRLRTDVIDFYMIHWAPGPNEGALFDSLAALKKAGKVRAVGVSLKTAKDIDDALDRGLDGFMVRFSLLDPDPYLSRLERMREKKPAVIVRSALKEGFLTGKYKRDVTFPDPNDQRHSWTTEQIAKAVDEAERFRFLEQDAGSMVAAAARYPLSFSTTSTVVLGTKSLAHAQSNFGEIPGNTLSADSLARIAALQNEMGLRRQAGLLGRLKRMLGR